MRKLTIALSTAALAMSGAAFAQAAPERAARPDVTRAQAQARAEAAFARMDADKNGTIDQADGARASALSFPSVRHRRDPGSGYARRRPGRA